MAQKRLTLQEYFDYALREVYSFEDMLASFGQQQTADVLHSVVEMAFAKLCDAGVVMERDLGSISVLVNEFGEPSSVELVAKPRDESLH